MNRDNEGMSRVRAGRWNGPGRGGLGAGQMGSGVAAEAAAAGGAISGRRKASPRCGRSGGRSSRWSTGCRRAPRGRHLGASAAPGDFSGVAGAIAEPATPPLA
jgi:hypothetical protein